MYIQFTPFLRVYLAAIALHLEGLYSIFFRTVSDTIWWGFAYNQCELLFVNEGLGKNSEQRPQKLGTLFWHIHFDF